MTRLEKLKSIPCEKLVLYLYKLGNLETYIDDEVCATCKIECGGRCTLTSSEVVEKWLNTEE